jgi:hypothetical protein
MFFQRIDWGRIGIYSEVHVEFSFYIALTIKWEKKMIDWLIIYCFKSSSRIFHLYGDGTIAGEGLQNLILCSALRAFEQGGIFIVLHLFSRSHPKDRPIQSPLTTRIGMQRTYSNPDPHRAKNCIPYLSTLFFKRP